MTSSLIVRTNSAKEYLLNAEGKEILSLDVTKGELGDKKIVDGNLVIEIGDKRVVLSNWENISTIKTTDDAGFELVLTEEKAAITNPIIDNKFKGTNLSETIDATNQDQVYTTTRYKK